MKIGLSMPYCVRDIAKGEVPIEKVYKIIAGTKIENTNDWDTVINQYTAFSWKDVSNAVETAEEIYESGKLIQPRLLGKEHPGLTNGHWINVPDWEEILPELVGRKGLRRSKPTKSSKFVQYIWRMCRFHSGQDVTMPVMCQFDLADWFQENNIPFSYAGYSDPLQRCIVDYCDELVDECLDALGENKYKAAIRWKGLI